MIIRIVTIIFSKNTEFGNLESENSVCHTSMQKTVKNRTNKGEKVKKIQRQKNNNPKNASYSFESPNF